MLMSCKVHFFFHISHCRSYYTWEELVAFKQTFNIVAVEISGNAKRLALALKGSNETKQALIYDISTGFQILLQFFSMYFEIVSHLSLHVLLFFLIVGCLVNSFEV